MQGRWVQAESGRAGLSGEAAGSTCCQGRVWWRLPLVAAGRFCLGGIVAPALAFGADPEELELMFDVRVAIMAGEGGLDLTQNTVIEFHNPVAALADEVVVMVALGVVVRDFEPGEAIAQVDTVDQAHALEESKGTVNGGQVTGLSAEGFSNLLGRGRPLESDQRIQDDLTRSGHPSGLAADPLHPLMGRSLVEATALGLWLHGLRS